MPPYTLIDKAVGETPLQALERYRATQPELHGVPMAYAGRLDPMASGLLLVLIGEECKRQQHYHGLDKHYTFSVILGVGSDTYDPLGRLIFSPPSPIDRDTILPLLSTLTGELTLPYPPFSSKTVQGKPLHTWTLEGRLSEIELPTITTHIYHLQLLDHERVSATTIAQTALKRLSNVTPVTDPRKALGADFRRPDVVGDWQEFARMYTDATYPILHLSCTCSSGTYMRSLAHFIGTQLGTPALATNIHRHTIGRYRPLWGTWGVWTTRFRAPQQRPGTFPGTVTS